MFTPDARGGACGVYDGTTFYGRGCSAVRDVLTNEWVVTLDDEAGVTEQVITGSAESPLGIPAISREFQYWSKTTTGFRCGVLAGGSALANLPFSFVMFRRLPIG